MIDCLFCSTAYLFSGYFVYSKSNYSTLQNKLFENEKISNSNLHLTINKQNAHQITLSRKEKILIPSNKVCRRSKDFFCVVVYSEDECYNIQTQLI